MNANSEMLKQFTAQKENLKLVAAEALEIQQEFGTQQEKMQALADQNRVNDADIKKMRNDLEQYRNKLSTELFDKLKEVKEMNNFAFALEKERKNTLELLQQMQDEINELKKQHSAETAGKIEQLRDDMARQSRNNSAEFQKLNDALGRAGSKGGTDALLHKKVEIVHNNVKGLAMVLQHYVMTENEETYHLMFKSTKRREYD